MKTCDNPGQNILRLFDILWSAAFTTSETKCDIRVAEQLKN